MLLEVYGSESEVNSKFDLICCGGSDKTVHEQISLEKFEITADDVVGKSAGFMGSSQGTDNFIEFTQQGVDYSFQFQVKRNADLKTLFELEKAIKAGPRQQSA